MKGNKKSGILEKHMCGMMTEENGFKVIKEAAKDARFICKACGRAAKEAEHLCVPVKLAD